MLSKKYSFCLKTIILCKRNNDELNLGYPATADNIFWSYACAYTYKPNLCSNLNESYTREVLPRKNESLKIQARSWLVLLLKNQILLATITYQYLKFKFSELIIKLIVSEIQAQLGILKGMRGSPKTQNVRQRSLGEGFSKYESKHFGKKEASLLPLS